MDPHLTGQEVAPAWSEARAAEPGSLPTIPIGLWWTVAFVKRSSSSDKGIHRFVMKINADWGPTFL